MQKLTTFNLSQKIASGTSFEDAIKSELGDLTEFDVFGTNVLVVTYVQSEKTVGGIIRIGKSIDEDRHQGKVGLVIKMGQDAFKYDGMGNPFEGRAPKIGEYVMFHTSDARELGIRGVSCKLVHSELIRMKVPSPDAMY